MGSAAGVTEISIGREWPELVLAFLLTLAGWLAYRQRPAVVRQIASGLFRTAERQTIAIILIALLPVVLRLALLPWQPPPVPYFHDEFGHLLAADTLIHGRLANPPHPLWRQFQAIYVLQQPTYASIYPIGQAIPLAIGKAVSGHPWAGVLLSAALMSGAITWMLYGCVPAVWAALGGLLAAAHYGLSDYWLNSYWGALSARLEAGCCSVHFAGWRQAPLRAGWLWRL